MIAKEIVQQTQPTPLSCVCTCIAMLVGKPAQEMIDKYNNDFYFGEWTLCDILDTERVEYNNYRTTELMRMIPGFLYLLTVPSLNIKGGNHEVLVDYRNAAGPVCYDPAKGYEDRLYYTFDEMEADENVWAFGLHSWVIDLQITGDSE